MKVLGPPQIALFGGSPAPIRRNRPSCLLVVVAMLCVACPKVQAPAESRSSGSGAGVTPASAPSAKQKKANKKKKAKQKKANKKKFKNYRAYWEDNKPEIGVNDLSPRVIPVIDVHEHVKDAAEARRLLKAMDRFNIKRTCLLSASWYTFTLNNRYGFERFKENNEALLRIKKTFPNRFCAFMTLYPPDEGNLDLVKDFASRGGDGLKLYLGHGAATGQGPKVVNGGPFHMMPLNDPRMLPIYEWAQATQFPIIMHVNFIKYFEEFVQVMERFPYLRISVPHFGLHKNTGKRLERVAWLFERYPNFYTDISFGFHTFHKEGFEAMSKWKTRSHDFLERYAHRIMYASDMVLEELKTEQYIDETLRSYFQWVESEAFRFFMVPEHTMKGLYQRPEALKKIYWEAPSRFLLLDAGGGLPDRSKGWPPPQLDGQPPTVPTVGPLPATFVLPAGR